jgi:putative tryptophan/tyrosine transport system substrate-binding protein
MRRRDFIAGLGGAAAWPAVARAQQGERVRRIGWLINREEIDPEVQTDAIAFREALLKLGWIEGRNLRIDVRFGARDPKRIHDIAMELVSLAPEVIVTAGGVLTRELQQRTQTIPIVLTGGPDPVSFGLMRNIARPEGNITGFVTVEPSTFGKWIELLKEVAPRLARVCVIFHPETLQLSRYYEATLTSYIEPTAARFGVDVVKTSVRNSVDIVRAIDTFAVEPNGGVVVMPPRPSIAIRDTILQLAAEHRLPTINSFRDLAAVGGLISYGSNSADLNRGAASYVDRLLRGAKVSELPAQFPTRYQLVVNLKTAKAIGLTIPESFLLRADEVIE